MIAAPHWLYDCRPKSLIFLIKNRLIIMPILLYYPLSEAGYQEAIYRSSLCDGLRTDAPAPARQYYQSRPQKKTGRQRIANRLDKPGFHPFAYQAVRTPWRLLLSPRMTLRGLRRIGGQMLLRIILGKFPLIETNVSVFSRHLVCGFHAGRSQDRMVEE